MKWLLVIPVTLLAIFLPTLLGSFVGWLRWDTIKGESVYRGVHFVLLVPGNPERAQDAVLKRLGSSDARYAVDVIGFTGEIPDFVFEQHIGSDSVSVHWVSLPEKGYQVIAAETREVVDFLWPSEN